MEHGRLSLGVALASALEQDLELSVAARRIAAAGEGPIGVESALARVRRALAERPSPVGAYAEQALLAAQALEHPSLVASR